MDGKYINLLDKFSSLKVQEKSLPTFIEIAGYPHYENVSSNILSFYFDTENVHQLKELFVISLLNCIEIDPKKYSSLKSLRVEREFTTNNNKRIDLFVEFEEFTLTIENKIFHNLNNDLVEYEKFISHKYFHKENFFIILSPETSSPKKFLSLTYNRFFEEIKRLLGSYIFVGNSDYINYLKDYILTMTKLFQKPQVNEEFFDFFLANKNQINELIDQTKHLQKLLYKFVKEIRNEIILPESNDFVKINKWIWSNNVLVIDFIYNEGTISMDFIFSFDKIEVQFFPRNKLNFSKIESTELFKTFYPLLRNGRYIIFEKNINFYEIDKTDLIAQIEGYIKLV